MGVWTGIRKITCWRSSSIASMSPLPAAWHIKTGNNACLMNLTSCHGECVTQENNVVTLYEQRGNSFRVINLITATGFLRSLRDSDFFLCPMLVTNWIYIFLNFILVFLTSVDPTLKCEATASISSLSRKENCCIFSSLYNVSSPRRFVFIIWNHWMKSPCTG